MATLPDRSASLHLADTLLREDGLLVLVRGRSLTLLLAQPPCVLLDRRDATHAVLGLGQVSLVPVALFASDLGLLDCEVAECAITTVSLVVHIALACRAKHLSRLILHVFVAVR